MLFLFFRAETLWRAHAEVTAPPSCFLARLRSTKSAKTCRIKGTRLETCAADVKDGWYVLEEVVRFPPGPKLGDLWRPSVLKGPEEEGV